MCFVVCGGKDTSGGGGCLERGGAVDAVARFATVLVWWPRWVEVSEWRSGRRRWRIDGCEMMNSCAARRLMLVEGRESGAEALVRLNLSFGGRDPATRKTR
jgi:hypothetical protein